MERIGMIASKISSGSLFLYNCYVIVISFLLSFLLFLLAGCAIFLGLWVLRLGIGPFIPSMSQGAWNLIFCYSLSALTVLVGMINLVAVLKNIKPGFCISQAPAWPSKIRPKGRMSRHRRDVRG